MSEMAEMILSDAGERMEKAVTHARSEMSGVRSGRAAPQLVEKMPVEAYGVEMTIQQMASIAVPEARQLMITPHDPSNLDAIEKAIRNSDLGLSPSNDGRALRLNFPQLTAERRQELVKIVKNMTEDGKIAIRNIRREARKELESAEKDKELTADELARAEKDLDRLTQENEAVVDTALASKEQELLEV